MFKCFTLTACSALIELQDVTKTATNLWSFFSGNATFFAGKIRFVVPFILRHWGSRCIYLYILHLFIYLFIYLFIHSFILYIWLHLTIRTSRRHWNAGNWMEDISRLFRHLKAVEVGQLWDVLEVKQQLLLGPHYFKNNMKLNGWESSLPWTWEL